MKLKEKKKAENYQQISKNIYFKKSQFLNYYFSVDCPYHYTLE